MALLVVALAGCQDGAGGADPSPDAEPSTSDPTGEPSQDVSASPTGPAAPATGETVQTPQVRVTFPRRYRVSDSAAPSVYSAEWRGGGHRIAILAVEPVSERPMDQLADIAASSGWDADPRRLGPVTVGGVECFHLKGRKLGLTTDLYGALRGNVLVELEFTLDDPASARQRVIESVLATVVWEDL